MTKRKYIQIIVAILLLLSILYLRYFNSATSQVLLEFRAIRAILLFGTFYIMVVIFANLAKYFYSKRNRIPKGRRNNVHFGIENISNMLIGIGFFLMLISLFGINPMEFITSLTIVAAAIAILTKEYIVDFLSGIYLSFSSIFEIGDYVKLENQKGKILEISLLKVKILNDDDDIVIIPNSKVHYNEIINYTKRDVRLMSVDFQIALKYIESIADLEKEIILSLQGFSQYIEPKSYNLKVVDMKMDHMDLKFQYKLKQVDMEMQRRIRKQTMREVFNFISSKKELTLSTSEKDIS